ncbi:MAG: SagB/ThcOx family dehydrogenase [Cyanobacteria bacterium P01_C01_bin.89]
MAAGSWSSFAHLYHQRTKYDPETLANQGRSLNWDRQPSSYKHYPGGLTYDLRPYLAPPKRAGLSATDSASAELSAAALEKSANQEFLARQFFESIHQPSSPGEQSVESRQFWLRLSRLLRGMYGMTARVPRYNLVLRSAPSAGGLYPTEVYVLSRGTLDLPAGIYNYQARSHGLVRCDEEPGFAANGWTQLREACFWHPALDDTQLAIATTAIFFRSVWRYEDRGYRRICLDTGHVLGNLELAAALTDFRPHCLGTFDDEAVDNLLGLDREAEGTLAIAALADLQNQDQYLPLTPTALPMPVRSPDGKEEDIAAGELWRELHQRSCWLAGSTHGASQGGTANNGETYGRSRLMTEAAQPGKDKYNFPFGDRHRVTASPLLWGKDLIGLEHAILTRRSTRKYNGAPINMDQLFAILQFTYQPQRYVDQGLDSYPDYFALEAIETFVTITAVDGLEPGCYYYAPHAQELRQIRFKLFKEELHYLALYQDLARDAAAVVFQTANLGQAIERWGDRAYRYLHMDSGHLGQRLSLAAERMGLGASGIAGFFDDQVNTLLDIPFDEVVLYLTTLGIKSNG